MTRDRERILDASANRAAEALRVMEDAARFLADDAALSAELKALRHDLRALAPSAQHRDTEADVGTSVSTEDELTRSGPRHVAAAAAKRLQESLRSLEEWSKSASVSADARSGVRGSTRTFEQLRYRAYTLERRLLERLPRDFQGWRCCVVLTESLCAQHWLTVAAAAAEAGADCIQLREKSLPDRRDPPPRPRPPGRAPQRSSPPPDLVINDRVDIALAAGARGAHLGQTDLPLPAGRAVAGDRLLLGVSASEPAHARAAMDADYCGVGAMFPTETKPKPEIGGPDLLAAYLALDPPPPPALAIGGITPGRIPELAEAAAGRPFGVAVSSYVCGAADPGAATRAVVEALPAPLHSG